MKKKKTVKKKKAPPISEEMIMLLDSVRRKMKAKLGRMTFHKMGTYGGLCLVIEVKDHVDCPDKDGDGECEVGVKHGP